MTKEKEINELSVDEMADLMNQSISVGCGLISYRKHAKMLKKLILKLNMLHDYKKEVEQSINDEIEAINNTISEVKGSIRDALLVDESIPSNKAGGKTIKLPDVATISLTKENEHVVINDPELLMEELVKIEEIGDDFFKTVKKLNTKKVKEFIMANQEDIKLDGVEVVTDRSLRINFK